MTVLHESGQGKTIVAEVWHVCNISQQHLHETPSGPNEKVNVSVSFDRAG